MHMIKDSMYVRKVTLGEERPKREAGDLNVYMGGLGIALLLVF